MRKYAVAAASAVPHCAGLAAHLCSRRHDRPRAYPQLCDHRPYRPRQVDPGRPADTGLRRLEPARDARAGVGFHGPGARARHHHQGPDRAPDLLGQRRRGLSAELDGHPRPCGLGLRGQPFAGRLNGRPLYGPLYGHADAAASAMPHCVGPTARLIFAVSCLLEREPGLGSSPFNHTRRRYRRLLAYDGRRRRVDSSQARCAAKDCGPKGLHRWRAHILVGGRWPLGGFRESRIRGKGGIRNSKGPRSTQQRWPGAHSIAHRRSSCGCRRSGRRPAWRWGQYRRTHRGGRRAWLGNHQPNRVRSGEAYRELDIRGSGRTHAEEHLRADSAIQSRWRARYPLLCRRRPPKAPRFRKRLC